MRVGNAHAGAHVALDAIGRDRIAQAVLRQRLHAGDRLGQMRRRQRHQHLLVRHAAIAPLRKARQRQAGLAGLERPSPGIGARGLADHAPFEFLVAGILQPVDQNDHLARRRIDQTDIRRIEPPAGQRAHRQRLVFAVWNDIERFLALARILGGFMPDADVSFTGEPLLVLRREPDHGAALRADEIVGGDADGPAQPRGHADDLVGGVNRRRSPDLRDRRHLVHLREHLHADHGGLQAKQVVQIGHHAGQIEFFVARCCLLHELTLPGRQADPCGTRWLGLILAGLFADRDPRVIAEQALETARWSCPISSRPQAPSIRAKRGRYARGLRRRKSRT